MRSTNKNNHTIRRGINSRIADDINATVTQVEAACELLDSGATVPFISRYRKEVTGGLTDTQLRLLEERLTYLRELETRRSIIIKTIDEQGKLDDTLHERLCQAATKSELEDLYLPFKQKRKTKGLMAIEAGLAPLAESLWTNPAQHPDDTAMAFINADAGIEDTKTALDGAKSILIERFAEDASLRSDLRKLLKEKSWLCSAVMRGKESVGEKFQNYFDFQERLSTVPSHRALAMFRGRSEGILSLSLKLPEPGSTYGVSGCIQLIARHTGFSNRGAPADDWRALVVDGIWKTRLANHLEADLFVELREQADNDAIKVFTKNLKDLLLAAPAGARCTLALDPGYRSGVKVAVTDATGKVLDHATIYPHAPQKQWDKALAQLTALCTRHKVELIAIGNGTASRETDQLAATLIKAIKNPKMTKVVVSESGASVYSASAAAEQELPELDVTIRGAVSIARRLQDPLAELVKIDPKAIGVGQYQHDVSQPALARSLDATVEDCVNRVGVDLNTASVALLNRVAGLSRTLAANIVRYRDEHGPFVERKTLNKVARLGPKAFEQCAGFLRITNGKNPLDASGVHPEAYPVVEQMVNSSGLKLNALIGDSTALKSLDAKDFISDKFGLPTVHDILAELEKPGRDPRPEFHTANFSAGVDSISDLKLNLVLEGQVTNVTNFGAFVDIGVHQDGLVHISAMSDQFVKDPHQVVRTGDIVKVKVMTIEVERKRIGLSMRLSDHAGGDAKAVPAPTHPSGSKKKHTTKSRSSSPGTADSTQRDGGSATHSALALALQASLDRK